MTDNINARELFLKVMGFESAGRTLNWEFAYWGGTLLRWYKEGLPKISGLPKDIKYGEGIRGPGSAVGSPNWGGEMSTWDHDVANYFRFDEGFRLLPYNSWVFPLFEKKIINEDDRFTELWDTDGIKKRVAKDDSCMPFWLEYPVKNYNDWERIKEERFNLNSIDERWIASKDDFVKETKNRTFPLLIFDPPVGFFGSLRELIGDERLFMLYYDEPGLLKDMLEHLCNFWLAIAEELTSHIDFDMASFWEDMSGKQGSLIAPKTFREFMTPYYKKLIDFLKLKGLKYFLIDTDGKVDELTPLFLEVGINVMLPFEQQAGNNLIELRKKYPELRMMGGFDKNTLYKGKEFIDKELEKMPYLISKGGYIPFADHDIPPNSSWENFKYYRNKLQNIIFSTKILTR